MTDQLSAELRRLVDLIPAPESLTTRQINDFSRGIRQFQDPRLETYLKAPMLEAAAVAIQAALVAKWFDSVNVRPNQVEDAAPQDVVALGEALIRVYYAAQQLVNTPKNS